MWYMDCGTNWNATVLLGLGYMYDCDIQEFANQKPVASDGGEESKIVEISEAKRRKRKLKGKY